MKVLVACEFSGVVRDAFTKRGHDAWSCDLLPKERGGNHIQDDVLKHLDEGWDLMIAHPPCTYLCNSGVCWLYKQSGGGAEDRWSKMIDACFFFKELWTASIPKICIENPIPHHYAVDLIGDSYTQIIQPYMFGHPERKATCLWLKGLPRLKPTNNVRDVMITLPKKEAQRIHYTSPRKDRWKIRSRTFSGIADAMADQWGNLKDDCVVAGVRDV